MNRDKSSEPSDHLLCSVILPKGYNVNEDHGLRGHKWLLSDDVLRLIKQREDVSHYDNPHRDAREEI